MTITRPVVAGSKRSAADGMSVGDSSPISGTSSPGSSAASAPTETFGDSSPRATSGREAVRVARPRPSPTIEVVAMMTKLAGMPMIESPMTIVEETIAAVSGRSVMSLPSVSRVRGAIANGGLFLSLVPIVGYELR